MAVQVVNAYAYSVRKASTTPDPKKNAKGQSPTHYPPDSVIVVASSQAAALAMLQAAYGADFLSASGGATVVSGAITTLA